MNKIVDRFLYESLVTDEVLAKLEREVTECLKPFLGTCMTQHTLSALEAAVKNRLDALVCEEQLPDCIGYFTFFQDNTYRPSKLITFYNKPFFRKTPQYSVGYTCYDIEEGTLYKYVVKEGRQKGDLIVYTVEYMEVKDKTSKAYGTCLNMLEWDLESKYPSISAAKDAKKDRIMCAVEKCMKEIAEIDSIEED